MSAERELQEIAAGASNVDDLKPLHQLAPPLFEKFSSYVNQRYVNEEALADSASRRQVPIGLPSVTWTFASLTQAEYQYIRTNFVPGTDAFVTIRSYDDETDTWKNYNAIMRKPTGTFDGIYWNDVTFPFVDLREIV